MKNTILGMLIILSVTGCATSGIQTLQTNDSRACAKNFTYSGSFLAGRSYKTNVFIPKVSKKTAMERAARYIINDGWQITNTNENLGIISASRTVSYGEGKTVPLNIGIESKNGGVKVSIFFSTSGGVISPLEAIKNHFCSTIEAIELK